jgi:hypothetical protein
MADHKYNDPTLSPLAFLRAVYNDPSVPLHHRMHAAQVAAPYEPSRPVIHDHGPTITIIIESIIPGKHDTIELYNDLAFIKQCWDLSLSTGKLVSPDQVSEEAEHTPRSKIN